MKTVYMVGFWDGETQVHIVAESPEAAAVQFAGGECSDEMGCAVSVDGAEYYVELTPVARKVTP